VHSIYAIEVFWHSSAHLLGQALERLYNCHLCVGPPLADGGFYYDCAMNKYHSRFTDSTAMRSKR
jgi:threonyl-tRNA synthetase